MLKHMGLTCVYIYIYTILPLYVYIYIFIYFPILRTYLQCSATALLVLTGPLYSLGSTNFDLQHCHHAEGEREGIAIMNLCIYIYKIHFFTQVYVCVCVDEWMNG